MVSSASCRIRSLRCTFAALEFITPPEPGLLPNSLPNMVVVVVVVVVVAVGT
jgi:hypothetical protein